MHARLKLVNPCFLSFFCSFLILALIFLAIILVLGGWVWVISYMSLFYRRLVLLLSVAKSPPFLFFSPPFPADVLLDLELQLC